MTDTILVRSIDLSRAVLDEIILSKKHVSGNLITLNCQ